MGSIDGAQGPKMTVGYIGLGNAGFSMSSNIPKNGYSLVVHDQDQSKVQRAVAEWQHTTSATTSDGKPNAEAFKDCSVIITMLPHGKIVRDVLFGSSGIARALQPGTIVVDTSSSAPSDTKALGKELAQHELKLIDSPITQTYMHATDDGRSTLMVGSDSEEDYATVKPILECMASYIFHMGPLGSGHAVSVNPFIRLARICKLCTTARHILLHHPADTTRR